MLKIYNTLSRSLDVFEPMERGPSPAGPGARPGSAGKVKVYGCGPTIYGSAHIGNFRSFTVFDLFHRYLEWIGYDVRFVMNLTDVDDKTIDAAVRKGVTLAEYTDPIGKAFLDDMRALGFRPMDSHPLATRYVPQMVEFVKRLVDKGNAYPVEDGSVYFSIASFPGYGKLAGIDPDQVKPGARVAVDEYAKDDARDFALWKGAKEIDEQANAAWDSPWGRGRPGWHLECSVMALAELGETLDVHLGGEDLVFPHHEDEIAQSEAANGKPFVRYWMHVKHLLVDGRKMSKSAGNFFTVRQLLDEEGFEPAAIRHQMLSAQYRRELNFTIEGLEASKRAVQRLLDFEGRLKGLLVDGHAPAVSQADGAGDENGTSGASASQTGGARGQASELATIAQRGVASFAAAMNEDLNSADALGAIFVMVSEANNALDRVRGAPVAKADRDALLSALHGMDSVLGLLETAHAHRTIGDDIAKWVEGQIQARADARKGKDFKRADEIRQELAAKGIVLEDGAGGTRWKLVSRVE
jgi:cysteinyl-tRNA synthetase